MEQIAPAQPPKRQPPKPGQNAPVPDEDTERRFRKRKSKKKKKSSESSASSSASPSAQALYNTGVRAKRAGEVEKALDHYQRAAQMGYAKAMVNMGAMYEKGDGVGRDDETAVRWFREASGLGDAAAQFALGMHLKRGLGVAKDAEKAWAQLSLAASSGHASAQYNLALMYEGGVGCAVDAPRAKELYEAAAAQGHAKAMVNLGSLHDRGASSSVPASAAAAAAAGAAPALACEMYRQALEVGGGDVALAKYNLSCNLKQGRGVAPDGDAAVELLHEAAMEGVPQAQYNLATYVLRGGGGGGGGGGRAGQRTARGTALPTPEAAMALLAQAADGGAEKAARSLARIAAAEQAPQRTAADEGSQNEQGPANDALSREPAGAPGVRGAPSDACRARVRAAVEKRRQDRRLPAGGGGGGGAGAGAGAMQVSNITDSSEEDDAEEEASREAARRRRREQNKQRVERRTQQQGGGGGGGGGGRGRGRGTSRAAPVTASVFAGRSRAREHSLPS